jgi:hypothetical protein
MRDLKKQTQPKQLAETASRAKVAFDDDQASPRQAHRLSVHSQLVSYAHNVYEQRDRWRVGISAVRREGLANGFLAEYG